MDKENKGYLDQKDIKNLLKSLGDQWDEQDIDVIFEKVDPKEARKVTFEQFKKIMHSPTSMYWLLTHCIILAIAITSDI